MIILERDGLQFFYEKTTEEDFEFECEETWRLSFQYYTKANSVVKQTIAYFDEVHSTEYVEAFCEGWLACRNSTVNILGGKCE